VAFKLLLQRRVFRQPVGESSDCLASLSLGYKGIERERDVYNLRSNAALRLRRAFWNAANQSAPASHRPLKIEGRLGQDTGVVAQSFRRNLFQQTGDVCRLHANDLSGRSSYASPQR